MKSVNFGQLTRQTVGHQLLGNMEVCCTSWSIAWGVCGADSRDRKQEIGVIPLVTCYIFKHMYMSVLSYTGPEDEAVDLEYLQSHRRVMPWPFVHLHRAKLSLGWARGAITRWIPSSLYNHGKKKGEWPKGKRGIGKNESKTLLRDTCLLYTSDAADE